MLVRWITFYESIYELDEIERPTEKIIEDDDRLDDWFDGYRADLRKRLAQYHKSKGTRHADRGVPKAKISYGLDE